MLCRYSALHDSQQAVRSGELGLHPLDLDKVELDLGNPVTFVTSEQWGIYSLLIFSKKRRAPELFIQWLRCWLWKWGCTSNAFISEDWREGNSQAVSDTSSFIQCYWYGCSFLADSDSEADVGVDNLLDGTRSDDCGKQQEGSLSENVVNEFSLSADAVDPVLVLDYMSLPPLRCVYNADITANLTLAVEICFWFLTQHLNKMVITEWFCIPGFMNVYQPQMAALCLLSFFCHHCKHSSMASRFVTGGFPLQEVGDNTYK